MEDKEYQELLDAINNRDFNKKNILLRKLGDECDKIFSQGTMEEWRKTNKMYEDAIHLDHQVWTKDYEDKLRQKCRSMSQEDLEYYASPNIASPHRHVYQEEIDRREKEREEKENQERLAKIKEDKRTAEIDSIINYYEIMKILIMSIDYDSSVIELNDIPFDNKLYSIITSDNSYIITCNDGRILSVNIIIDNHEETLGNDSEDYYRRNLFINYAHENRAFAIIAYHNETIYYSNRDIAEVLIHKIEPATIDRKPLSWDYVKDNSDMIFTNEELEFIRNQLRNAIIEDQDRRNEAEIIKNMVLKLSTSDRRKLLNKLKKNK